MSNVIDFNEKRRARLGRGRPLPSNRRARLTSRPQQADGFVQIGVVSDALLKRLLME